MVSSGLDSQQCVPLYGEQECMMRVFADCDKTIVITCS